MAARAQPPSCPPRLPGSPLPSWALYPGPQLDQCLEAQVPRSSYRIGRIQQRDLEGNKPREAGVGESQALHIEVHTVLATRELQRVTWLLRPQDHAVAGGLFVCWERAGGTQVCTPTSETLSSARPCCQIFPRPHLTQRSPHRWIWQELPLRRKRLKPRLGHCLPLDGVMGCLSHSQLYRKSNIHYSAFIHSLFIPKHLLSAESRAGKTRKTIAVLVPRECTVSWVSREEQRQSKSQVIATPL